MAVDTLASNLLELTGAGLVVFGLWSIFPALGFVAGGVLVFLLGTRIG